MSYKKDKRRYGGQASWRRWRDFNLQALTEAGVPSVALESERNWAFFVQEANAELLGGPRFNLAELSKAQRSTLRLLLQGLPEATPGMDLFDELERLHAAAHAT